MKKSVLVVLVIFIFFSLTFASTFQKQTINLSQVYTTSFFWLGPQESVQLSSVPLSSLKSFPKLSKSLFGILKLGNQNIYVLAGYSNDEFKLFLSKPGVPSILPTDKVTFGIRNKFHNKTFYSAIVNIKLNFNGISYSYPIRISIWVGKNTVSPLYYYIAAVMVGKIKIDGLEHTLILSNVAGNGSYSDLSKDGISVDCVDTPRMSQSFYPATQVAIGNRLYKVLSVSPAGTKMVILKTNANYKNEELHIGDNFPNFNVKLLNGKVFNSKSIRNDITLLYFWKVPFDLNADVNVENMKIANEMTLSVEELYENYSKYGLKVLVFPVFYGKTNYWANEWRDKKLQILLNNNDLHFPVVSLESSKSFLGNINSKMIPLSFISSSQIYILKNGKILSMPLAVWNIYQNFDYMQLSPNEMKAFVKSLMEK